MLLFWHSDILTLVLVLLTILPFATPFQITALLPSFSQKKSPFPGIVVLDTSPSGTTTLSIALRTLGYDGIDLESAKNPQDIFRVNGSMLNTYTILPPTTFYQDIAASYPKTKFILPVLANVKYGEHSHETGQPYAYNWLGSCMMLREGRDDEHILRASGHDGDLQEYNNSVRKYFSERRLEDRLLVISLNISKEQGEVDRWASLCNFLELGYSVIERLGLKTFPVGRKVTFLEETKLRDWLSFTKI